MLDTKPMATFTDGLTEPRAPRRAPAATRPVRLAVRRAFLFVPTFVGTLAIAVLGAAVVSGSREAGLVDWLLLLLFVPVMAWECLVLTQVGLGFVSWMRGKAGLSPLEVRAAEIEPISTGRSRTALVVPIFNEDVDAVFAAIDIMRRSLSRLGRVDDIDVHVLSDSRDAAAVANEEAAVARAASENGPAVLYRHRATNNGRKAGNIAEFLRRTEGTYDFMIVLDADSLMSGGAIRKLVRLMEENERVALIQTISYAAGRRTLFARTQQFAVRLHARLSLKGMAFWQGPDGLYYGHNAILRCAPFLRYAELPVLPGKPPLGGEILCHDVVESALLRRAGWEVRMLPELGETWEEMPTNIVDLLGREQRWCQGNLQHLRVLPMPGLTTGSRIHIAFGIGGYLVAPLWWMFAVLGALRVLFGPETGLGVLAYGGMETGRAAAALLALSLAILLVPRILNAASSFGRAHRRSYGGGFRLLAGMAIEQVFAILLVPVLSLYTARFVFQTFRGSVVPWSAQSRADRTVGWPEAFGATCLHLLTGALFMAAALSAGGWYAVFTLPVAVALLLAPVTIAWTSRLDLGLASRRAGLFLTPDETSPTRELRELHPA